MHGTRPMTGLDSDTDGDQIANSALDLETAFFLLKDPRRRLAIDVLRDVDGAIDLGDLAEKIATIEVGDDPDPQERKRVYIALSQTHIDTLVDEDVVEYRDFANLVSRGPEFDALARVLDGARLGAHDRLGDADDA